MADEHSLSFAVLSRLPVQLAHALMSVFPLPSPLLTPPPHSLSLHVVHHVCVPPALPSPHPPPPTLLVCMSCTMSVFPLPSPLLIPLPSPLLIPLPSPSPHPPPYSLSLHVVHHVPFFSSCSLSPLFNIFHALVFPLLRLVNLQTFQSQGHSSFPRVLTRIPTKKCVMLRPMKHGLFTSETSVIFMKVS